VYFVSFVFEDLFAVDTLIAVQISSDKFLPIPFANVIARSALVLSRRSNLSAIGDCFVPRSEVSFEILEKTFLDNYIRNFWFTPLSIAHYF